MRYTKEQIRSNIPFFGSPFWVGVKGVLLVGVFILGTYSAKILHNHFPASKQRVSASKQEDAKGVSSPESKPTQMVATFACTSPPAQSEANDQFVEKESPPSEKSHQSQVIEEDKQEKIGRGLQYASSQEIYLKNQETLRRLNGQ